MTDRDLNVLIKSNRLPRVLFFFGEETFMLESRLAAIKKKLVPGDLAEFNYVYMDGKAAADEIIAAAEMFPQGAERRLVLVKNCGIFDKMTTSEFKSLKKYIPDSPDYTCLIFWETNFDPKKQKSLKFIEDTGGGIVNFEFLPINKLEVWVEKKLIKAEKEILAKDLTYFVRQSGVSMRKLDKECQKLILYMGETRRRVTRADIDAVVDKSTEVRVYDIFRDCIIPCNIAKAKRQILQLKRENASPTMIMGILHGQVYELLMCKMLRADGLTAEEMVEYYDRKPPIFAVNKAIENSKKYDERFLVRMVKKGLMYSSDMKSGRIDQWDAVELYVSELVRRV